MATRDDRPSTIAVVLCAGQGTRMRAARNKVFLPLLGKPLLVYTLEALAAAREVGELLLVAQAGERAYCEREIVRRYGVPRVSGVIAGGATRHQSEQRALEALRPRIAAGTVDVVLIHDGARPFVPPSEVDALVREARRSGGALLATPIARDEGIARVDAEGRAVEALPAEELWRAQTPQAFAARALLAAYDVAERDGFEGTDTAATYERSGGTVRIVPGSAENFKVTTPHDLVRAERILRERIPRERGGRVDPARE